MICSNLSREIRSAMVQILVCGPVIPNLRHLIDPHENHEPHVRTDLLSIGGPLLVGALKGLLRVPVGFLYNEVHKCVIKKKREQAKGVTR